MPQQDVPLNLLKGDRIGFETDYRDSLPVNMSGIVRPILGSAGYMLQTYGMTKYGTGYGVSRGGVWNERHKRHYRVSGSHLISVDEYGVSTVLGEIAGAQGVTVSMPYSFNTQAVIAGGRFYLYDDVDGFREVIDGDLGKPIDGVWVDGYYMMTDGEYLFHTELDDEMAINPLAFDTSQIQPDPTLGLGRTVDNKVIVFNRYSTEYFSNVATENFAFSRISGRLMKSGIVGTHCKCELGGKWYTMGGRKEEDVSIHTVRVGNVQNVASREVDKVLCEYTERELSKSVLEARVVDNYSYLIVHLPKHTLMYNVNIADVAGKEQAWTILKSYTTNKLSDHNYSAIHGVYEPRLGRWAYGDKQVNFLGLLAEDLSTHYGELAEWEINTPFVQLESLSVDEILVETVTGHSVTDDATVAVSLSPDGVTYGKEQWKLYGEPAVYNKRFISHRLGYVRNWVTFRLRGVSKSRMAFSMAKLKVS